MVIVVEVVLGLAEIVVVYLSANFLPAPLRDYVDAQGEAELEWGDWVIGGLALQMIPLLLLSYIGLWRLWRFARVLYLCTGLLGVALVSLVGPEVRMGWAVALEGLSWTVSGLILGLIYFSPLKESFARVKTSE